MTLFGLIRHGQTNANLDNLYQGSTNNPLNDKGREQARHALSEYPDMSWDGVITSTLDRAVETGKIIAEGHGIPVLGSDPRLVEIDWGIAEGHGITEMEKTWPNRDYPGREPLQDVVDRACDVLHELSTQNPDKNLLLITHGTLIRLLLASIAQYPLNDIPNACLSLVRVDQSGWSIEHMAGDSTHTDPVQPDDPKHPTFTVKPNYLLHRDRQHPAAAPDAPGTHP